MLRTVLIVDADTEHDREQSKLSISKKLKCEVVLATTTKEALSLINTLDTNQAVMLIDIKVLRQECLRFIREIKLKRPDFPIIVLVEYGDLSYALEAIEAGANDFLTKPFAIERLALSVESALRISSLSKMVKKLEKQLSSGEANSSQLLPYSVIHSGQFDSEVKIKKLKNLEEEAIRFALNVCNGSMSKAARSLGIGRSTLYRKLDEINRNHKKFQMIRENQTTRPMMVSSEMEHS